MRLAAQRARAADIAGLGALLAEQDEARDAGDADRFFVLDDEFHSALCELSGHAIAWDIVARANGHLNRVRRLSLAQPRYLAEMLAEHKQVAHAVERGDPDAAEAQLRHHLRMVLSDLPAIRGEHPEYFDED